MGTEVKSTTTQIADMANALLARINKQADVPMDRNGAKTAGMAPPMPMGPEMSPGGMAPAMPGAPPMAPPMMGSGGAVLPPEMTGVMPPDPAMGGQLPPDPAVGMGPPPGQMVMLSLDDLRQVVQEMMGASKGGDGEVGESGEPKKKATLDDVIERLESVEMMLSGGGGVGGAPMPEMPGEAAAMSGMAMGGPPAPTAGMDMGAPMAPALPPQGMMVAASDQTNGQATPMASMARRVGDLLARVSPQLRTTK